MRETSSDAYSLELLRRAYMHGDQHARVELQELLSEIVVAWLHGHSCGESACRLASEEHYVALALERFWQATAQQQVEFTTFAGALAYLRASLHSALLDTRRAYSRPKEDQPSPPVEPRGHQVEDQADSNQVWDAMQTLLPDEREQRLAYLLYHCGLKPREILRFCPQEWTDIEEIYLLRRDIIDRLQRNADRLHCGLTH